MGTLVSAAAVGAARAVHGVAVLLHHLHDPLSGGACHLITSSLIDLTVLRCNSLSVPAMLQS
jgi:hypothetical protein